MAMVDLFVNIISTVIFIAVNGVVLWWLASKLFKIKVKEPWKLAYKVAIIAGIIAFLLGLFPVFITAMANLIWVLIFFVINAIVLIYLIMRFYKLPIGRSALMWLGVLIADIIIGFVIGVVFGFVSIFFL
jgi:hypothetical protein